MLSVRSDVRRSSPAYAARGFMVLAIMITRFLRDAFALVDVGNTGFLPALELCDDTVCKARLHGFFRLEIGVGGRKFKNALE